MKNIIVHKRTLAVHHRTLSLFLIASSYFLLFIYKIFNDDRCKCFGY